jgi:hypothetical protein
MSNKKSEKIKADIANIFSGHVTSLKITAGLGEFQLKSKKHGVKEFTFEAKDAGYLAIIVASLSSNHKVVVQLATGNFEGGISSIIMGDLPKQPKPEKSAKIKENENRPPETSVN